MDWQKQYEAGETPWDRGTAAPALVDFLTRCGGMTGDVLVPGCGTGSDLIPIAQAGATSVLGLDIAPLAVQRAGEKLAGIPSARVIESDLFVAAHGELAGRFDWVWEHTCFCAIPLELRVAYVAAVAAALRPGGKLAGVFFINPWDENEDQTQGPPFGCSPEALIESFAPHFDIEESYRP